MIIYSSSVARKLAHFRWARVSGVILLYVITSFFVVFSLTLIANLPYRVIISIFFLLLSLGFIFLIVWLIAEYKSLFIEIYDNTDFLPYRNFHDNSKMPDNIYALANNKKLRPKSLFGFKAEMKLVNAIKLAESKTSCEIRIHIAPTLTENPEIYIEKIFNRLRIERTKCHNGCLVAFGTIDKEVQIYPDLEIRVKISWDYFNDIKEMIKESLDKETYVDSICNAMVKLGNKLATIFPIEDNINELPDNIDFRE